MESVTYLKNLKITPKKLRLMLPKVKKMKPSRATEVLAYMPDHSARVLYSAIRSAMANARHTLKIDDSLLQFKTFFVEEGQKLRRFNPGGRGSPQGYKKRYAHVKIVIVAGETASEPTQEVISDTDKSEITEVKEVSTKKKAAVRKPRKKEVSKNSK